MPSTIAATKRSWICSVTIRREDAVQRCPVEKKAPLIAQLTASARSASSSTTSGFLPPISSWNWAQARGALLRDVAAGVDRAREADRGDVGRVEQRLADHRAAPHDQVEDALRHAALLQDVGERPGGARHQVGGLEHHGVAVGERRRDLPGRDREREVPGRDQPDHAERLAVMSTSTPGPHRGHPLAGKAQRLAGEELEDLAGARRLADAFGQRLALLARQQLAELLPALQDLVAGRVEQVEALLRRAPRPGREGRLGGRDRPLRQRPVGARVLADHVVQIGRVDVVLRVRALDPLAADQMRLQRHGVLPAAIRSAGEPAPRRPAICRRPYGRGAVSSDAARGRPRAPAARAHSLRNRAPECALENIPWNVQIARAVHRLHQALVTTNRSAQRRCG